MSQGKAHAEGQAGQSVPAGAVRTDIAEKVLGYFSRNAGAMDSVEGIARFWVHEDRSVVERCLADLHARGLLDRRSIAGTDFYSLPETPRRQPAAPASPGESTAPAAAAPVAPAPDASSHTGTPGRILVVDDEASVRKFLVAALTDAGHSVAAAEDGERAVEIFQADPCDLVVTDVLMPGISGLEVLQAVKRHSPATEVIVVTAHASLETAVKALREGAYDLLTKPLADLETLYRVVDRALEKRRLSSENRLLVGNLQARNVELKETVARLAAVNEIGKATTGLLDMEELYDALVRLLAQHLKARRVSVLVAEPNSDTMMLVASVGITDQEALHSRVRVGEGIAGKVAATQSPLLVQDIEKSSLKSLRTGGKYTTSSFMSTPLMVSYPIRYQRKRVGVINVSDKHSGDPFTEQDLEFLSTLSSQVAVAVENARLVKEMENGYLGALVALIQAAEDVRPETRGHSKKVAELAKSLGIAMDLQEPRIELLVRAAALHEVGRLATPSEKGARARGRVEPSEGSTSASVMAAERILAPIASLRAAREIILHSADWFDAAPIPFGADRSAIPLESRILSICEEFVRLTGGNGHDPERARQALEAIRKRAGRKHDPEVVGALSRVIERGGSR
jgi:response regulator RpfG family c-di-GMP phosphodiesterase